MLGTSHPDYLVRNPIHLAILSVHGVNNDYKFPFIPFELDCADKKPPIILTERYMSWCMLLSYFHDHRVILAPKTILPRSPYTETKMLVIKINNGYKIESVENFIVVGLCMREAAPNRE